MEEETKVEEPKSYTTEELRAEFEVIGFLAPFVMIREKATGVTGTMQFNHMPRVYFNFVAELGGVT